MAQVSATEANRNFSSLFRRAKAGETIVITDRGQPVVTLSPASGVESEEQAARRKTEIQRRLRLWKELQAEMNAQPPIHLGKYQRDWGYE